jgi:NAD(P)-dependent dehydrogenase (short-subunit alcohol dehydrogenase family)
MDLDGAVAIVTGASRGVGAATAIELARAGARVVCAARATDASPLPIPGTLDDTVRAAAEFGGTAVAHPTNLADDAEVEGLVDATVERFGRVDVLVNNAAITFPGDRELPMKRFDLVFAVDLRAPVLLGQLVVPHMIEQGCGAIVNVSSAAALNYYPGQAAYGAAKIALEHWTVSLAAQLRPHGIPVNTFRIDVPVASEGFVAALPDFDHSDWEPPVVAAEGILWMLRRPPEYTGHNAGMARLRAEHGIMPSRATRPHTQSPDMVTRPAIGEP